MKKLLAAACLSLVIQPALADYTLDPVAFDADDVVHECFPLKDIGDSVAGAVNESGITSSTAGLQIRVRTDVTGSGWEATYTQSGGTIEAIATIDTYAAPSANSIRIGECATGSGLYQIMMANAIYATTNAKNITVEIQDTSSPAFATQVLKINMNVADGDDVAGLFHS